MYNFQCVQVQCVNVGIDCTISMCKAVCKCTLCNRVVNVSFIFYISLKYVACTSAIFDMREIRNNFVNFSLYTLCFFIRFLGGV